jgi:hypothetical protein
MSVAKTNFDTEHQHDVSSIIRQSILSIQNNTGYGSVEIVIHDGKVMQIERREKVRLTSTHPIKK